MKFKGKMFIEYAITQVLYIFFSFCLIFEILNRSLVYSRSNAI